MGSCERDLYWAIRSARAEGIDLDKFLKMLRQLWKDVRYEMDKIEDEKLAELKP